MPARVEADAVWPLVEAMESRRTMTVTALPELRSAPWNDRAETALVLPIRATQGEPAGVLVVGMSRRRPLDDAYRAFLDVAAGHVGTALANAGAHEAERGAGLRLRAHAVAAFIAETRVLTGDSQGTRAAWAAGRILVIDDDLDMRVHLTRLLADRWTVEAVADGPARPSGCATGPRISR